ncbi:unnamed protein product, partial [Mesorhabditis spiculigera]
MAENNRDMRRLERLVQCRFCQIRFTPDGASRPFIVNGRPICQTCMNRRNERVLPPPPAQHQVPPRPDRFGVWPGAQEMLERLQDVDNDLARLDDFFGPHAGAHQNANAQPRNVPFYALIAVLELLGKDGKDWAFFSRPQFEERVRNNTNPLECPLCMIQFTIPARTVVLECGHAVCMTCCPRMSHCVTCNEEVRRRTPAAPYRYMPFPHPRYGPVGGRYHRPQMLIQPLTGRAAWDELNGFGAGMGFGGAGEPYRLPPPAAAQPANAAGAAQQPAPGGNPYDELNKRVQPQRIQQHYQELIGILLELRGARVPAPAAAAEPVATRNVSIKTEPIDEEEAQAKPVASGSGSRRRRGIYAFGTKRRRTENLPQPGSSRQPTATVAPINPVQAAPPPKKPKQVEVVDINDDEDDVPMPVGDDIIVQDAEDVLEILVDVIQCGECPRKCDPSDVYVCVTCGELDLCSLCMFRKHQKLQHMLHEYNQVKLMRDIDSARERTKTQYNTYNDLMPAMMRTVQQSLGKLEDSFDWTLACVNQSKTHEEAMELLQFSRRLGNDLEKYSEEFMPQARRYVARINELLARTSTKYPKPAEDEEGPAEETAEVMNSGDDLEEIDPPGPSGVTATCKLLPPLVD